MTARTGPLASPGFWLRRAALDWQARLARELLPLDLTPTQFSTLAGTSWLSRGAEWQSQQTIADFTSSDRATTSRMLRALEQRGLVERRPSAVSGREILVRTTAAGTELSSVAAAKARAVDTAFFGSVSAVDDLRGILEGVSTPHPAPAR